METAAIPERRIRFGPFELNLASRELSQNGLKIRLQGHPMDVLVLLLEHPGEVVSREFLQKQLWARDTFVDFEHGLNVTINRLREALGESAEVPRFIETLPRVGYRLIAQVADLDEEPCARPVDCAALPEPPVENAPPSSIFRKPIAWVAWAFLSLAAIGTSVYFFVNGGHLARSGDGAPAIESIAVLPLESLARDPEQEYFADGMTDALITDLAKIRSLKVISRTSVMQFKNTTKPLPEIARALGVDAILEGSAQRSGEHVRITVQLIRALTDTHLWAESYERDTRDVLTLQGEIARDVAREIKVALTSEEQTHLSRQQPVNPFAYEFYLKGQYHYYKWRTEDFRTAIEYFQKAVDADPHWAPPYASLANSYGWLWISGAMPPQEALPRFNAALKTALQIDNSLPEAHYTLAVAAFYYRWDWDEADREFRRALSLDPSLVEARFEYAWFLSCMGRLPEALSEAQRAVERDPLSVSANLALSSIYAISHQDDRAIAQLRRALEIDPNDPRAHGFLVEIYEVKQMYPEAIKEIEKTMSPKESSRAHLDLLQRDYQQSGAHGYWRWKIAEAIQHNSPYTLAIAYAGAGDRNEAMKWLQKSYQQHDWQMVQLPSFRVWDPLRSDPRFQDLLHRLKFPK